MIKMIHGPLLLFMILTFIAFIAASVIVVKIQVRGWRAAKSKVIQYQNDETLRAGYEGILRLEKLSSICFALGLFLTAVWLVTRFMIIL